MSNKELLKLNMQRNWRGYEAFLLLIAVLEAIMMVYGLRYFDFRELRRRLYFFCYVLLFCCTVAALLINRFCLKSGKHDTLFTCNVYLFNWVLIFWSAMISALDMIGGGYPVTYMTIMAAVGSMVALAPVVYGCMAVLSSIGMIAMVMYMGGPELHVPFYLNFFIFLLVIVLVEVRNYHTLRNQYLLDKRLEALAEIDGLTQISNRRCLDQYMAQLIGKGGVFTFSLLDVDHFKSINDTYGHQEGDLCLVRIANVLTEVFGRDVFRYGGDEFAVISTQDGKTVAEKFALVNRRLREEVTAYTLQTCAGVYEKQQQDDERRVFERADSALYQAKHTGKARAVIYSEQPQQQ